jgi:uncharacterized cupin superfamily protein
MPILRGSPEGAIPAWADYSNWGVARQAAGDHVARHFHDSHEFVLIVSGRVRVETEGAQTDLGPGDAVLTKMGDEHEWWALEDSVSIWATTRLMGECRPGHLFRNPGAQ